MFDLILHHAHLRDVLSEALRRCRHRLLIATADVKDLHVPGGLTGRGRSAVSIVMIFRQLADRGVQIELLHSAVPTGPFLEELKSGIPATLDMRRCVRTHMKTVIADGTWMYLGSANLTGAGIGAKSERRRNFEAGIVTDDIAMIDTVVDAFEAIFQGEHCPTCGRTDNCPVPLEEPEL